jgi:hypothetical protein
MNLEERVRRLEELVARLAAGKLPVIETNCLSLVNQQGQVQGILAAASGEVALALCDPSGKSSIAIGVGKAGPHMEFTRKDGKVAMQLAVDENGLSMFEMSDRQSRPRFSVAVDDAGPHVQLLNEHHQVRLELSIGKGDTPIIVLNDDQGKMRLMLHVTGTDINSANLVLRDATGRICGLFDVDGAGKTRFVMGDHDKTQIMMHVDPVSSEIVFADDAQLRLALGLMTKTKQPYVSLYTVQSQPRVTLGVTESHCGLAVNDSHAANRLMAIVDSDERPWFIIRDDHQKDRLKMTIMPDGSSGISLHDSQGHLVALLCGGSRQASQLILKDATGRSVASLTYGPEGPSLVMLDDDGQPIFVAPPRD